MANVNLEADILKYLTDNKLFVEDLMVGECLVKITLDGDWKHEHARLDWLMEEKGWVLIQKCINDNTECDWYNATHFYQRKDV